MNARLAMTLALGASIAWCGCTHAQEVEPPAGTPEGADYTIEAADSLGEGDVEVGVGFTGSGAGTARRRHARFSGDSLDASVRDGPGDALAGAQLEGPVGPGRFGLGRGSPAWGRGLAFGRPREPWSRGAPGSRRADGDLAWYRVQRGAARFGAMGGRLDPASRHAFEVGAGGLSLGLSGGTRGVERASAWWLGAREPGSRHPAAAEVAVDRRGRWIAEGALDHAIGGTRISSWGRAGRAADEFVKKKGPGQALALQLERRPDLRSEGARSKRSPRGRRRPPSLQPSAANDASSSSGVPNLGLSALLSWWRFAPGAEGARAMVEIERSMAERAQVVAGFEEQRGARREPQSASAASREWRQGVWGEWRASRGPIEIGWRHERWGARPWAREVTRVVSGARIAVTTDAGISARVSHTNFRLRRGEHAYLAEREPDRLVLRALSGTGERVRLELAVPFGGGRIRATADRTLRDDRTPLTSWTVDWTRRAKARRSRAAIDLR